MDSELVSLFNNMGAGTFIILVIFCVTIISAIITKIFALLEKNNKKVKEDTLDDIAQESLVKTVNKLAATVEKIDLNVDKMSDRMDKEEEEMTHSIDSINNKMDTQIIPQITELDKRIDKLELTIDDVVEGDQNAIKSFITTQYQKWMPMGEIDIYSLSIIEDRYKKYRFRHGNTFVEDLMIQLRKLKIVSTVVDKDGKDPIHYFELHPDHHPRFNNEDR